MAQQARRTATVPDSRDPVEGRVARRRRLTRARLLEAAYSVMAEAGVDGAKIKDITDRADVGFGTFYNYFESRDDLAGQVLDCVIHDLGLRNIKATAALRKTDPARVMPTSIRLVLHEATHAPMWQWWALRPDLLADRMRDGFKPFAINDMRDAISLHVLHVDDAQMDSAWTLTNWIIVGGIRDIVAGNQPPESEAFIAASIMRLLGASYALSVEIAQGLLPRLPLSSIDWSFSLQETLPKL